MPAEEFDAKRTADADEGDLRFTEAMEAGEAGGVVIGRYHLRHKIGEGGMGEVWLAEQREPIRRRVALKLVKAGMDSREVISRFESERQALALMHHPSISKVLDAGTTPQGAPYFVMEYFAGVPITTYCDNHKLNTRQRLELFILVCEGVQHAHQKAILHRDLKPSNILVMEVDGKAAPKIIDFGVAKALHQSLSANSVYTRVGTMVGTPEYMSPEQANSSGEDIDTRTDVYSLGIIFYELLAGAPPLDLKKVALDEFLRRLREEEPVKPSVRIRTQDRMTSSDLPKKRRSQTPGLVKEMRGDLDSIALKALEKDRSRRYGSPSEFAADIRRHLDHQTVLAIAPSAAYRARKFARRCRGTLVTACAFVLVLMMAAGVTIRQSIRANREAAAAQAVNDFLENDVLAQASAAAQSGPQAKPDPDLKVRTALDRAAARIQGKFDNQPEVEAAIRDTIGQTYVDLGLYPEARKQFERALDLYSGALGGENPKTLKIVNRLGTVLSLQGKYAEAEALLGPNVQAQRRVLGAEHPDSLKSMNNLSGVYYRQGKYELAEALFAQTLEIQRRVLGPENPQTLNSMTNLAIVYMDEGKCTQAESLGNETLQIRRRVLGPEHPDTLGLMNNLASNYKQQGKYAQAQALDDQTLEMRRRVLGPEHPETLGSMSNLSIDYLDEGKYAEAEALCLRTLEIRRRVMGPEHPETLGAMNNLAVAYLDQGKYAQAEALFLQTVEMKSRVRGPEHPSTLYALSYVAFLYQLEEKYALAESYAARTLAGRRHVLHEEHPDTMASAADLALAYQSEGKFTQSEPLAREAWEVDKKNRPDDWQRFRAESLLGASLAGQKKYAEAEPLLLEGYQGMAMRKDKIKVEDGYHLDRAREWIIELSRSSGKPESVVDWRKSFL